MKTILGLVAVMVLSTSAIAAQPTVTPTTAQAGPPLPVHIGGRVERTAHGYKRQWPGTYFEAGFRGPSALFRIGQGDVILRVSVDGALAAKLVKPKPGLYRVAGLSKGSHTIRADVASESQSAVGPSNAGSGTGPFSCRQIGSVSPTIAFTCANIGARLPWSLA